MLKRSSALKDYKESEISPMIFFIKYKVSPLPCRNKKRRINHSKVETQENSLKTENAHPTSYNAQENRRQRKKGNKYFVDCHRMSLL